MAEPPRILCIGGLDPSGGAGLLADAEAVRDAGGTPLGVATAITVQSSTGCGRVETLAPDLVVAQADRVFRDERPRAIKLGMLGRSEVGAALRRWLVGIERPSAVVVDPVLRASSGVWLFTGDAPAEYALFAATATVLTPNLAEAELLSRRELGSGASRPAREAAARELGGKRRTSVVSVVLKGGHAASDADDLVYDAARDALTWLSGERLPVDRRGTGCRFASTLATRLALGDPLVEAARVAKVYVRHYLGAR